jgi:hypothetical protein
MVRILKSTKDLKPVGNTTLARLAEGPANSNEEVVLDRCAVSRAATAVSRFNLKGKLLG